MFGTIDSWLIYRLTGTHATDPSNASRTMLFNIHERRWDDELLRLLEVPPVYFRRSSLPPASSARRERNSSAPRFRCRAWQGDQQAALFGHACFEPGDVKNTYGTGCFTLMNTGPFPVESKHNLLATVAWDLGRGYTYALEGSVFIAGAVVQWLRDQMGLLADSAESEQLARAGEDRQGVYIVPAFVGLGAPYWDSEVRGTVVGLSRGTSRAHFVRAALEAIAYQSMDLFEAMEKDSGRELSCIKADGGASQNSFLMQFQADITGTRVILPEVSETTALGAAYLAGLAAGYWESLDDVRKNWRMRREFAPRMSDEVRTGLVAGWRKAVATARNFR
jgi:glycerol kinase